MRVLFVSDTHLGFDLPTRPRVAQRRRGPDFFDNFKRALAPALAGEVDVVVHGGDLLYRSRVPLSLADAALAPLRHVASRGVPVLLVPGNHERGRLPFPLLAMHDRLHVFDRPRAIALEARGVRATFVGFPYQFAVRHRFGAVFAEAMRQAPPSDVRVLCMHHCVEGATCGPGNFTFRFGSDVIRTADLPRDVAVTLCGHIHRHQVLSDGHRCPVIYAGSIERTSFAEAAETKGYVLLELTASGLASVEFQPLPARPMIASTLCFDGVRDPLSHVASVLHAMPADAVVQLRVAGDIPKALTAGALRKLAGSRNVTLVARQPTSYSMVASRQLVGIRPGQTPPPRSL